MPLRVVGHGKVKENGDFVIYNRSLFSENVSLYLRGKDIKITAEESYKPISDGNRRYYYGILLKHVKSAFYDAGMQLTQKETDDKLRRMFLVKEVFDEDTGEVSVVAKSLSKEKAEVGDVDFKIYLDRIIRFADELLDYAIPPKQ